MKFEQVLPLLRDGHLVRNGEWLSDITYVAMMPGYPDGVPINQVTADTHGLPKGTVMTFKPYLQLRRSDHSFVPYTPSNGDIFSEVWEVYPKPTEYETP